MAMLQFEAALDQVHAAAITACVATQRCALADCLGRFLAEDIRAPFSVPGFDHAAMDGFAIAYTLIEGSSVQRRIVATTLAGEAPFRALAANEAVRIMTGAPIPPGCDRVVPVESSVTADDASVRLEIADAAATHIRRGDDDYHTNQLAMTRGQCIDFAALGVLASFGLENVQVAARPKVSLLVTGSELQPAGAARLPGQIHDSNGSSLRALLSQEGIDLPPALAVADDRNLLRARLLAAASEAEVLITTGGASAGQADYVPGLIAELGEVLFWKVAMRPGMPILFGRIGSCLVFGLPGNPVAVVASFLSLVRPALRWMQGSEPPPLAHARLGADLAKSHSRLEFRRGSMAISALGICEVTAHDVLSSGVLRSVLESNTLIMLQADRHRWQAGDVVPVLRYR